MGRIFKKAKTQIPSTKLQINRKFQYPMTKTFDQNIHRDWPYCCLNLCQPAIMSFDTNAGGSVVWNFEFVSLGFV